MMDDTGSVDTAPRAFAENARRKRQDQKYRRIVALILASIVVIGVTVLLVPNKAWFPTCTSVYMTDHGQTMQAVDAPTPWEASAKLAGPDRDIRPLVDRAVPIDPQAGHWAIPCSDRHHIWGKPVWK